MTTEIPTVSQSREIAVQYRPTFMPLPPPEPVNEETAFNWRRTIDVLFAGRWTIVKFAAGMLVLGILFYIFFPPNYQGDGLIQIQSDKESRPPVTGNQAITYDINGDGLLALGEIEVLQSRMVFLELIKRLNLLIEAEPNTFPIIGGAFYRANSKHVTAPVDVPDLLRHFAWGGEKIDVQKFDVPDDLHDKKFLVKATETGYDLIDPDGDKVLSGKFGVLEKKGSISILVASMVARWGTTFVLTRLALQTELEHLADRLKVEEKTKESGIISLTYKGKNPELAAAIINNVEEIYTYRNTEWRSARADELQKTLKAQLPHLRDEVQKAQQALNAYQLEHGSVDVSSETQLLLQHGADLETARLSLAQQRDEAVQRFTPKHPMVVSIDEKLASIDAELQKLKVQATKLPATQQEMLNRTRDLDVANQLYTAMLNTIQQQQVVEAGNIGNIGGNVRIVDSAYVPEKPTFPKVKILLPISILLGGMFGVVFLLARDYMVNAIHDEGELESRLGLPTLAHVPFSRLQKKLMSRLNKQKDNTCLLADADPEDAAVESLRKLRSALHFATLKATSNVIVIAGPSAGVGKSFIALNLASLLAFSGKRVVLIDADILHGNLYKLTDLKSSPGLTDYILEAVPPGAILQSTKIERLTLIAQGTRRANAHELLLHESFGKLVRYLSTRVDHIIIDTPGNLAGTTAAVASQHGGCALLIVRAGLHSVKEVEESYRLLTHAGADVRGVIFNNV